MARHGQIVVVGASLAGLRASEALRAEGYEGTLILVGAEQELAYDRPPLSKEVLAGAWEPERTALREADSYGELDLELHLGRTATQLDAGARQIQFDDGSSATFDGLIIATGASPRELPNTPPLEGIHTLRTLSDCLAIRKAFEAGGRVVVVGAGFIGLEVAATAHERGLEVTVLEALAVPLERAIGPAMGAVCADLHSRRGLDLRCEALVDAFLGGSRVEGVRLADGTEIGADVVVVGVGVAPNTGWLEGSGLRVENGVICDARCATSVPGIYAAGDVARWYNPLFEEHMRVEHWTNAAEQGLVAGTNLLRGPEAGEPYAPVPSFWSDQFERKIQFGGHIDASDEVRVVHGDPDQERFVAIYRHADRLAGVLTMSWPRHFVGYSRLIAGATTWDDALAHAAEVEGT